VGHEAFRVACVRNLVQQREGDSAVRILKVVQAYYPFQEKGGPVVKVRALAAELARRGHEVTVLTADLGLAKLKEPRLALERCRWGWQMTEQNVEAIYLPTLMQYRALTVNRRVIGFCGRSLKAFELVHFYGLYDLLGPTVSYFCRRHGIPYVIEPMGMYRPIDRALYLKRSWHRSVGGAFLRGAARIIATSEMEYEELVESGIPAGNVVVRYNGIDANSCASLPPRGGFRTKWSIPAEEPLILFLSRLIPRKGADVLIDAFAQACPQSGRLVIAGPEGEPGYRSYLERRARESGVERRVVFTGPVYDEEKKQVFADADIFALPSRYENFANAAAEAMACGIPVVITESCGVRSLVDGRAGLIVAPEKEALAGALRKLLQDKPLYQYLKQGCLSAAAQLRWDRLAEQMECHYSAALAEGNAIS
jgi:glycosyltransferase involved in cell wall biosynthesis